MKTKNQKAISKQFSTQQLGTKAQQKIKGGTNIIIVDIVMH